MPPTRSALVFMLLLATVLSSSCTYLNYAATQAEYARLQETAPGQANLKRLIDQDKFYVIGRTIGAQDRLTDTPVAIVAYSDRYKSHESVDTMHFQGNGTHFGLSLPAGNYQLVVFADADNNQVFDQTEVVGRRKIVLSRSTSPDGVLAHTDITLSLHLEPLAWPESFPVRVAPQLETSLFYPAGSIRSLNDSLFDDAIATLGMYDPGAFLEAAPTMFYALEEDLGHKIPVVFVHGIGGTPRSFAPLLERLDRSRFKPWIFYYPSGGDLDHQAAFFYRLFISGDVIPLGNMPLIVIAHSMGGLVVREALNQYKGLAVENRVELFISIASPLGGHAAAASGEEHAPFVLPAWRDLNPANPFIQELYRKPLPEFVSHHLLYAFGNSQGMKFGENSDGVVALASQLHRPAQEASTLQRGFNSGHTSVLTDPAAIEHIVSAIESINNPIPKPHLSLLKKGGFELAPTETYTPLASFIIRKNGHYLVALANGVIKPINPWQKQLLHGLATPGAHQNQLAKDLAQWLRRTSRLSPGRD